VNNGVADQLIKFDKKTGAVSAYRSKTKIRGVDTIHARINKSENEGKF